MVVIVWLLDLQLPVQIATKVVRSNPVHGIPVFVMIVGGANVDVMTI
jgi:hypothetical protein